MKLLFAQTKHPAHDKGPRAIGLLELPANGKAHLIPVAIMVNGDFYDAGAYKAAPVPMALEPGTVYEAERTGASLGLFTITAPLESNNKDWIAEGTWQTTEMLAAKAAKAKKSAPSKPRGLDEDEGPPKLRRAKTEENPASKESSQSARPAAPASGQTPQSTSSQSQPASVNAARPAAETPGKPPEDENRPVLHRGKPSAAELSAKAAEPTTTKPSSATAKTTPAPSSHLTAASSNAVQIIPAISDAGGPEPHSYEYHMTADDEHSFRKQALAIATAEIRAHLLELSETVTPPTRPATRSKTAAKSSVKKAEPTFENVEMHVFDLSSSNEPEVVLMAQALMPHTVNGNGREYLLTIVARDDIYGQLHKALANVTDADHLDVIPRLQLIDAVDADGDGRGELLFRRVSDVGSDYVIYRAIGDQLWPLFQEQTGE